MDTAYTTFAPLYDAMMHDVDYDRWAARLDALLRATLPQADGATIADCACGTGALSIRLARLGYRVTGIDRSEDMLRVAQEKTRKLGLRIPYVCMDMCHLELHHPVEEVN